MGVVAKKESELAVGEAMGNIFSLENALLAQDDCLHLEDMGYKHWFAPGLYGREITMPANMALTTMIHATEHIAFLLSGSMTIYSEDGTFEIEAPHTMITKIGTKRAIYTHSIVVFTTVHANPENETDIDKLVGKMTFESTENYLESLEVT